MSSQKRESVSVLEECIDLQLRKSRDYQNPNSNIVQAMHYRRGVSTIHDMISQKLLRAQSLLEAYENGEGESPNFESLEDTYKDLINYSSFAVSYIRGKMEGQDRARDMLNRPVKTTYIRKPAGGGTGTGVEVTPEEFYRSIQEADTSGGSSTGQVVVEDVEDDGFITVWPVLLGEPSKETQIDIPLSEEPDSPEARIKSAYFKKVAPKGRIEVPAGESLCTDNVAITRDKMIKGRKTKDVGDRMDEDFKETNERTTRRK